MHRSYNSRNSIIQATARTDAPTYSGPELKALKYAIGFVLAGSAAFVLAIFVFAPTQTLRTLGPASMSLIAGIVWLLLSRGRITAAIYLLVFGLWAAVTGIAFFNGGIRGMAIIVYPQLILILGWLVGTRAAAAMATLAVAATFGLVLAESFGVLPEPPPTPAVMRWIVDSFIFAFSVILITSFVRSYQDRLKHADRLASDLAQRSADRDTAIEALRRSESGLHEAQEAGRVGSYEFDIPGDCWRSSPMLDTIFGIDAQFPRTTASWAQIVHPAARDELVSYFENLLSGNPRFEREYRILRANDGAERWVLGLGKIEYSVDGAPLRMVGTIQDITERKHNEQALERLNHELEQRVEQRTHDLQVANRELESFAYSVSHDLRAPLRAIEGFSRLLESEYATTLDERGKDYFRRVRGGATRMGVLIDDMLKLSKISRQEMHRESIDLSALVLEAAEDLQGAEPERNVKWNIAPQVSAQGDPGLMRVVVQNLIGNAWKYSSKRASAHIEFGIDEWNGRPAFFVRDNGDGFDMVYADKLFGAFQRLHSPGEFPGTGIGLATVKRIIHRHGGAVGAIGKEDEGATFYFTL